jgi:sterol desaturase/sphingolipid hydroxylase (fatty acid hydroxylase superfamily)
MSDALISHEPLIRLGVFLSALLIMAGWEVVAERRPQRIPRGKRWPHNLLLVVLNTVALRLFFPMAAVGAAFLAAEQDWGLLNSVSIPGWISFVIAIVLLDLAIYFQHRLFHSLPWLWRLHRMHHADLEFDHTTGLRFHPLEILLSMGIKLAAVVALGASPLAVLIFEILLSAASLFNHGNVNLSPRVDRWLRLLLVTPDMHRVHHSSLPLETNSNYGFSVPWWDRAFCTYRVQPARGHQGMTIGLDDFRTERDLTLGRMLVQPFVSASIGQGSRPLGARGTADD